MLKWLLTVGVVACLAVTATAQEVFPGTKLPTTMEPSAIPDNYYPVKLKETGSGIFGDYYSQQYLMFGFSNSSGLTEQVQALIEILPMSWTDGSEVTVYGKKYLVTYIFEPSSSEITQFAIGSPLVTTRLKLKLMNPEEIVSIEPFPEMNKAKFLEVMKLMKQSPSEVRAVSNASAKTQSLSNAKQVATGIMIYLADYDDVFPYVESTKFMQKVTAPYTKNKEIYKTLNPNAPGDLRYNVGIGGMLATDIDDPADVPLLFDPTPWPDGNYLVAFADSHTKYVTPEEWGRLQTKMRPKAKRHGKPVVPPKN